jgi:hypothetical protein
MAKEVRPVDYHCLLVRGGGAAAAGILGALTESGVSLLAFSAQAQDETVSQLDLIPDDIDTFEAIAFRFGLSLGERQTGFLIRGLDRPTAITEILRSLEEEHVTVTAVQAVSAGAGRFGALIRVHPADFERASSALGADEFDRRLLCVVGDPRRVAFAA